MAINPPHTHTHTHTHTHIQSMQVLQAERDKAISQGKSLFRKNEEMKREKEDMQKRFEQQNLSAAAQRGQV